MEAMDSSYFGACFQWGILFEFMYLGTIFILEMIIYSILRVI
ncbi:hypothetical protein HMPREF1985_00208 [Mitsuokella sp. oral taxon 131 str. W9106]|nr:hypothetical protein HMPREF1985_00208 [Mitsuokella sp. oral taxon 131 str. W9106]